MLLKRQPAAVVLQTRVLLDEIIFRNLEEVCDASYVRVSQFDLSRPATTGCAAISLIRISSSPSSYRSILRDLVAAGYLSKAAAC
jgi:hypothetical protein